MGGSLNPLRDNKCLSFMSCRPRPPGYVVTVFLHEGRNSPGALKTCVGISGGHSVEGLWLALGGLCGARDAKHFARPGADSQ